MRIEKYEVEVLNAVKKVAGKVRADTATVGAPRRPWANVKRLLPVAETQSAQQTRARNDVMLRGVHLID